MIEVRIRHEEAATAVRLFDWDPADMDSIIPVLCNQGVRDGDGNQYAGRDHFTSEIVVEDGEAFFEVVFGYGAAEL
jgi:hypothetical protein